MQNLPTPNIDTRQRLINAAIQLFQRQGYYATGLNKLLQVSGSPKGSLYHHFPGGKSDLAVASLEYLVEQTLAFVQSLPEPGKQNHGSLLINTLFKHTASWLERENHISGSLLAILNQETTAQDTAIRQCLAQSYDRIGQFLTKYLQRDGLGLKQARSYAEHIIINFEGSLNLATALGSQAPLLRARKQLLALYEKAYSEQ